MKYTKYVAGIAFSTISLIWSNVAVAEDFQVSDNNLACTSELENTENSQLNSECDRATLKTDIADARDNESSSDRIRRKSRTDTKSDSDGLGGYVGATLGVFFLDLDESAGFFTGNDTDVDDAAFGSSLFAGVRFNRFLATDVEFGGFVGDVDSDLDEDEGYTFGALFLNPRFILPLGTERNSLSLFLSPGIGVSQITSSVEDEIDDFDRTTFIEDDTRFTWQVKGGVSVPVSQKFSVLGQARYASQTGDDAIDYFATEVGVSFGF